MSKNRITALGTSAVSAALVGSVLFAPAATAQEAPTSPSAYAIAASGIVTLPKTPYAQGDSNPDAVVKLPAEPLVDVEVLDAESAPGEAHAKVAGLSLLAGSIQVGVLTADCVNGKLDSNIADITLFGTTIPVDVPPNEVDIPNPIDDVVEIKLNNQVTNDDGSRTVTALSITLLGGVEKYVPVGELPVLGKTLDRLTGQTITLASATCAKTDDGGGTPPDGGPENPGDEGGDNPSDKNGGDKNGDDNGDGQAADEAEEDGTAPTPVPQPGHISVTG